jgi:formylglycine-generating enzyme required for sulfatase activity
MRGRIIHLLFIMLVGGFALWAGVLSGRPAAGQAYATLYLPLVRNREALPPPPPRESLVIPAGLFQMGCAETVETCTLDELPLHPITLTAYAIDRTEVTNQQYANCVAASGCTPPHWTASDTRPSYYGNPAFSAYPVIAVDWHQAAAFCRWAGGRLPTEAEWEKAARGENDTRPFPWGAPAPACARLNFANGWTDCVGDTSLAGNYPDGASPYGVLDLAGNVWEWVADWYNEDYYSQSPALDPQGPSGGDYRVLRGGSFTSDAEYVRLAGRLAEDPATWYPNAGFRCAYDQP